MVCQKKFPKFFGKIQNEEIRAHCIRSHSHIYTPSFSKKKVIQSNVITRLNFFPYSKWESCTTRTIPTPACLICLHTMSTSTLYCTTCMFLHHNIKFLCHVHIHHEFLHHDHLDHNLQQYEYC